jgi:alkylhydroperoxidase family enzyme
MVKGSVFIVIITALASMMPDPADAQGRGRGRGRGHSNATIRFADMDRNNDRAITRAEWNGSDRSFAVHDWNGDGLLSGDEVRIGAQRPPRTPDDRTFDSQEREYEFDDWTARGFTGVDHNRDGRITRVEMVGPDAPPELFSSVDVNRDRVITTDEWHWSRASFDARDLGRNGRLTREEFNGEASQPSTSAAFRAGQARGLIEGRQAGREDKQQRGVWDLDVGPRAGTARTRPRGGSTWRSRRRPGGRGTIATSAPDRSHSRCGPHGRRAASLARSARRSRSPCRRSVSAVTAADRAMLDDALTLTVTPGAMSRAEVDRLRAEGFADLAIHDICAITAYFAFVNRIADGLGVELEG